MDRFLHDFHCVHSVGLPARENTLISGFLIPTLKILGPSFALLSSRDPILFFMRLYGIQY